MSDRLKIGQEVLIYGYVDEIRKDIVIIRNEGGYFGTVSSEIKPSAEKTGHWIKENHDEYVLWRCSECGARTELDMTEGYGCGWKYCPMCGSRLREDTE